MPFKQVIPVDPGFEPGDRVKKTTGDYTFEGEVVSVFNKRNNGPLRVVVENDAGIVHIFNPKQLKRDTRPAPDEWR